VVSDGATNGAARGEAVPTPALPEVTAVVEPAAPEPAPAAPPMTATTLAEPLPPAEPEPAPAPPAPVYSGDKLCAPVRLPGDMLLPPQDAPSRYLRYLPIMFHEADFLRRYLLIFESIWEPHENRQSHVEMYFDAHTAPSAFLGWLAGWLGLTLNAHWPEARRRQLLAEAMNLYRWRGTSYGLARMIEVCTGLTPDISDGPPLDPFVFRVRLTIPAGSDVDPEFVEDLIRMHKPAHAGYILELHA
jgi:phage tail-like protein